MSFRLVLLAGVVMALGCAKGTEIPETEIVYLQPQSPNVPDAGASVDGDASTAFAPEELPAPGVEAPDEP
jgi:hypothetical protein